MAGILNIGIVNKPFNKRSCSMNIYLAIIGAVGSAYFYITRQKGWFWIAMLSVLLNFICVLYYVI